MVDDPFANPDHVFKYMCDTYLAEVFKVAVDTPQKKILASTYWGNQRRLFGNRQYYPTLRNKMKHFDATLKKASVKTVEKSKFDYRKSEDFLARRHLRKMGIDPKSNDIVTEFVRCNEEPLCSKSEALEDNNFVETVPYAVRGTSDEVGPLWDELARCNAKLNEIYGEKKRSKKQHHDGMSLAHTVVTGGGHASKAKNVSGSIHWNKNLEEHPVLQREILHICERILDLLFGRSVWYKDLVTTITKRKGKSDYLIGSTPTTSIWWSCERRSHNKHVDWNAFGASFLFVPDNSEGGSLTFQHPDMPNIEAIYKVKKGEVVAGRWGRSPHYNQHFKGAIVCTLCEYPVSEHYGFVKGIAHHERNNKNHVDEKLDIDGRKAVVQRFDTFIDELTLAVVSKLPDVNTARDAILAKVGGIESYRYCSKPTCRMLVVSADKHNGGRHYGSCGEVRNGYGSFFWKRKEPKMLDETFALYEDSGELNKMLCEPLRMSISKATSSVPLEATVQERALLDKMKDKMQQIHNNDAEAEIRIHSEHETSSWVRRVGWDYHLQGLEPESLLKLSAPVDDNDFVLKVFIEVFDQLVQSSYELLQTTTNPAGRVRWIMNKNRKNNNDHGISASPTKPFTMIHSETMQRYRIVMHTFIRVLYRISILKRSDGRAVPKFAWYGTQEDVLFDFLQYIETIPNTINHENYDGSCIIKCLNVIVAVFNQAIRADPYQHVVLSVLSVMGLKSDSTFESFAKTKQNFAAIFKILKLLVYQKSYDEDVAINGSDPSKSNILAILETNMDQFMTHESNSPISWMYDAFNYATELGNNDFSFPKITWLDDGDTLYCEDVHIKISELKSIVLPNVITELRSRMEKLLLLNEGCSLQYTPPIADVIYDSPTCGKLNYSFLKHTGNRAWVNDGNMYVYKNMCRNFRQLWLENLCHNEYVNARTYRDYEIQRNDFLKLLLFAIHVTSGQPGRGTEVVDVRYSNTATHRNLFYDNETKMLYMWSRYHKGYNQSNSEKHICRFIPKAISRLLIQYLWLVLPFIQSIEAIRRNTGILSNYIFTRKTTIMTHTQPKEGVYQSIDLTHALCKTFMMHVNARVTISIWRHMAIAIVDKNFKLSAASQNFGELDDEWDYQCAHSPAVADNTYANMKSLPQIATSKYYSFRTISQLWHNFLGLAMADLIHINEKFETATISTFSVMAKFQRGLRLDKLSTSFDVRSCLKRFFNDNNARFRGNQENVLHAIQKQYADILHIAGTGEGKSLSFLLIGFHSDGGITIVIAPLVSLKYDFLDRCRKCGINAMEWNATTSIDEYCNGPSLIFVTPESSVSLRFKSLLVRLKELQLLDRIVFDECHMYLDCTEDFRERMGNIGSFYNDQFGIQRIYMTATLPPSREIDFFQRMRINPKSVRIFRSRTRRENIAYNVSRLHTIQGCIDTVKQEIERLEDCNGKVILFCRTVDDVELLGNELDCYKYYREFEQKEDHFFNWKQNNGVQVITATSGLGAGIDIPNISLVILFGAPKTLSELVQATGRTGRNGKPSRALVLDIQRNKFFQPDQCIIDFLETNRCRRCIIDQYMDGHFETNQTCNYSGSGESLCDVCQTNKHTLTPAHLLPALSQKVTHLFQPVSNTVPTPFQAQNKHRAIPTPTPLKESNLFNLSDIDEKDLFGYDVEHSDATVPQFLTFDDANALSDLRVCKGFIEEFRNKCTLCVLEGIGMPSQLIFDCRLHRGPTKKDLIDKMKKYRDTIRREKLMPSYHGCSYSGCYLPQSWCPKWEILMTQGNEMRFKQTSSECIYRNIILEVIIGCSILSSNCNVLYHELKVDDIRHQTSKIVWGNVHSIHLLRTFFSIYKTFRLDSKKRKHA